jgi:membrane protease subunit (stomatin/prohibitin family)
MNPEQKELLQEFEHLNWGTTMPVTLLVGGEILSIRGWGNCSLEAADLPLFEAEAGDVDGLRGRVKMTIPMRLTDVLAEASAGKSGLDELMAGCAALEALLKSRLEADFKAMGLAIRQIKIESMNSF